MSPLFLRLLLRMALWIRHPPSRQQLMIMAVAVVVALAVVAADRAGLWPDSLRTPIGHRGWPR
jgi:hypothetical protein